MDIDFSGIGKQAIEMINSAPPSGTPETPAAVPASPSPVETPVAAATIDAAPVITGQAAPVAPEQTFDVDMGGGKIEKLTVAQVRELHANGLRQQDYTRKTQELSRQRSEVEAVYSQLQQVQTELQRRAQLIQQASQPPVPEQPPIDPTQPMTYAHGMQMAQAFQERMQQLESGWGQQAQTAQEQAAQYVEDRLQIGKYAEGINATLGEIYQQQPLLKAVPEFEDMLRFRVSQLAPTSIEETQQAFRTVSADLVKNIESAFNARQQQQVVQRTALTTQGIEPPGGAVPQAPTPNYRKSDGKLDWDRLRDAALQLTDSGQ